MKAFPHSLKIVALAGMYFVAAWCIAIMGDAIGFGLPIYPAAGVALGGLVCCGARLWPGVFLGAFAFNSYFLNYILYIPDLQLLTWFVVSTGMAFVATVQVLFSSILYNRFIGLRNPLGRTKDILIFIFLVVMVGCFVSASLSPVVLSVGGFLPWSHYSSEWLHWWLGNIMGVLLVAPLFFVFRQPLSFRWTLSRRIEASMLLLLFYITSQMVFGDWQYSHYPLVYLLAPCLVWAAYRFDHSGTVIAILMVSATAFLGTMAGRGPFTLGSLEESFALLQSYLLVLTIMTLILSAATTEAENAQTQAAQFGRVLDESSNEIYLFDETTLKFIQVNKGARENLGYSLEEMQSLTPMDLAPDFTRNDVETMMKPLRSGTENLVVIQGRHRRKNGTFYPVEVRLQLSHAGVWPMFVAVVQDITEKKKTEQELAQHRFHLEELVSKRTADLESTHLQLLHAEKLSATGKMAASMAHEFNNPIFGIRNVLEKIMRRVQMEENNKRFVKLAIQECDRVSQLIRKVLDFHSPSTDEKECVDLHESIDDMILLIQKKLSVRNIRLVREYDVGMPQIEVVPDQFMQVILNILQNAEEAIPEGGGRLSITTSYKDNKAQIQVMDTGTGISDQVMKNIFDPFFTTKPSVKGTGLGLSVTYGIIKKHGGEILVDSIPGQGTTFTILLPVRKENPATISG